MRIPLRTRILILLGVTAACLIGTMVWVSRGLMTSSFAKLERVEVSKNIYRAKDAIDQRVAVIHERGTDWANWDDALQFMKDKNKSFIDSNLSTVNLKLDAIMFVDTTGKLFYARPVNRTKGVKPPDCQLLAQQIGFDLPLGKRPGKGEPISGIVMHRGVPTMVSVRPIYNTERTGKSGGWIVFALYLDEQEVASISQQIHLSLSLLTPIESSLSDEDRAALAQLKSGRTVITHPLDDEVIAGFSLLKDMSGNPIQLLRTEERREIYSQGQTSIGFLVRQLALAAGVFILVTLFALERAILSRLSRLTAQVESVNSESGPRTRIEPSGSDEITTLAKTINLMLGKVEQGEELLRAQNENLEQTVLERTQLIEHQAFHDKLTGLPNRALFMDRLAFALDKAKRSRTGTAALFIDLDNFKLVNDSLGHDMGDQLLIAVAGRLVDAVRVGDTVARLGGDEFTILLENLGSLHEAEEVAHRILAGLRQHVTLGNRETFTCASVGVAFTSNPETPGDILLKNADTAMYRAKAGGKSNFVVFDDSMLDYAIERLELETDLRKAMDKGELFVHYQPLIDLAHDTLLGAEALARWLHPERGFVSPGQFIPIAEDTGLIVPFGYWILEQACQQAKVWIQEFDDPSFTMSVNLSGKQLQRDDVVERVKDILERTELPPANLKLEITESVLMDDRDDVIKKMWRLKDLGIRLALDDFGTGYSSLSTLRAFPIDTLKIDRAFISRLGEEDEALAIVEAILALARTMQMDVTGEGVETRFQADTIRALGCQTGQGYLFDKPLPAVEFGAKFWLSRRPDEEAA